MRTIIQQRGCTSLKTLCKGRLLLLVFLVCACLPALASSDHGAGQPTETSTRHNDIRCHFPQKYNANLTLPSIISTDETKGINSLLGYPVSKIYEFDCTNSFISNQYDVGFVALIWNSALQHGYKNDLGGNILPTNVPGIGILITIKRPEGDLVQLNARGGCVLTFHRLTMSNTQRSQQIEITAQFIQTAAFIEDIREITPLPLFYFTWTALNFGLPLSNSYVSTTGKTIVQAPACSLDPQSAHTVVELPAVHGSEFAGVGTNSPGQTPFSIKLNCYVRSTIHVTFSSPQTIFRWTGVMQSAEMNGMAKGVGIQLFSENTQAPLPFDQSLMITTSPNRKTQRVLPFYARYIQTENRITPGVIKATATFVIHYQ